MHAVSPATLPAEAGFDRVAVDHFEELGVLPHAEIDLLRKDLAAVPLNVEPACVDGLRDRRGGGGAIRRVLQDDQDGVGESGGL
jgi:hypothetical protein